ncbi:MAG: radical SAM family heme chaperone HemW [Muribaculaceae bacterium]|nr:radical SAM family heme chaperone HemW [Muribaculaceae bacterium]
MSGIYVHIPFCRRKCFYCDFYSVGERSAVWSRFVEAICREAKHRILSSRILDHDSPLTLYIGGGTPSLIPPSEFKRLAANLLEIIGTPVEFTIEVNPDDVTPEKVSTWFDSGVNRVSMGVQSFVDSELKAVGRRHTANQAMDAYDLLRTAFSNISLDLIFGLPGQAMASLDYSLSEIIKLNPDHISVYSLMYEERTALTRMRDSGQIPETSDIDSEAMFMLVNHRLREKGFDRYEISNYAKPGFQSIHNSAYWKGFPYVGLGPAAHSYDGLCCRRANVPDIKKYLAFYLDDGYGISGRSDMKTISLKSEEQVKEEICIIESLSVCELREEMIMTRLRMAEGLSINEYTQRFGIDSAGSLLALADKWISSGHLSLSSDNMLSLSEKGIMISDQIIASLF